MKFEVYVRMTSLPLFVWCVHALYWFDCVYTTTFSDLSFLTDSPVAPLTLHELVSSQLKLEDPQLNVSTYKLIRTVSYFMGNSFKLVPRSVSKPSENSKNWEIRSMRSMILVTAIETPPPFNCSLEGEPDYV